jgi:hypothetical protein
MAKIKQAKNPSRLYKLRFAPALTEPLLVLIIAFKREKDEK